jgi:soluble lytic murein transglycosylase-like protein
MQILGETARELGFEADDFDALADPETGIEYGCRKLAKCVAAHPGDTVGALEAYNGGGDPHYADMVLPLMERYR